MITRVPFVLLLAGLIVPCAAVPGETPKPSVEDVRKAPGLVPCKKYDQ